MRYLLAIFYSAFVIWLCAIIFFSFGFTGDGQKAMLITEKGVYINPTQFALFSPFFASRKLYYVKIWPKSVRYLPYFCFNSDWLIFYKALCIPTLPILYKKTFDPFKLPCILEYNHAVALKCRQL